MRIDARLGNSLDPSQVAIRVANLRQLQVEMFLPLSAFGEVPYGQSLQLRATAPVDRHIQATAKYVSPVVEPTSGTFRVLLSIENESQTLPSGFEVWLDPSSYQR